MKKLLLCLSALFLSVSFATAQTYEINSNTGTLANGNSTTKSSVWSSTELAGFKLEADFAEAMNVNSGLLQLYAYNSGSDVKYTIIAPAGYLITEYAVKYKKGGRTHTFKIYADNVAPQEPGSTTAEQTYAVTGLSNENVNFYLSGAAGNVFIKIMTISVTLQKVGEGGEEPGEEPGDDSAIMEQYAAIEKPTFGKTGNTTYINSAKVGDIVVENIPEVLGDDIKNVGRQSGVTKAIEVAAGAEFDLNITYQLNWGDLAIYQIDNDGATKEYGYYYGSWEPNGSTAKVAQYIAEDGISISEVVDGACTATYPISVNENHNIGDIIVVRAITGVINDATNSAYEQGISEGGYVDFLFVVTDAVAPKSYTLAVGETGYATLYLDFTAAIPADVDAYIVTGVKEDNWLNMQKVEGSIPANTGIIVNAKEGEYTFTASTENIADVTNNLLEGSVSDKDIQGEAYVLGNIEGVGLYKAEMNGTSWLNNANKAYLPARVIPASAEMSASLRFDFGGTTGVEKVEIRNEKEEIYDLTGRRVNKITKAGVYVVGGRKILVK